MTSLILLFENFLLHFRFYVVHDVRQELTQIPSKSGKNTRKLKFGSNVCNTVRNHPKKFPSIAAGKCLNSIMVDFSQNMAS